LPTGRKTLPFPPLFPLFLGFNLTTGSTNLEDQPPETIVKVDSYVLMTMSTTPSGKTLHLYYMYPLPADFPLIPSWVACFRRYLVV